MTDAGEQLVSQRIKISVNKLLEVTSRSGDIDFRFSGRSSAAEGIRGHQLVQRARPKNYQAEVPVKGEYQWNTLSLEVNGRMDGLYTNTDTITNTQANTDSNTNIDTPTKAFIVDEIKTLRIAAADLPVSIQAMHWGQVKLYAYLYAVEQDLSSIVTQLSYYHLDSGELTELQQTFSFSELQAFFERKAVRFLQWTEQKLQWRAKRNQSIRTMAFPYGEFRGGQRAFSVSSYRAMAAAQQLFVQAPTGIGKTIGSLFPAIKAIAEGVHEKVFFLTAKTSGRAVAEHALDDMRSSGLQLKSVTLTAKEKICFNPGSPCDPEHCEYAVGYYDKIDSVLASSLDARHSFKREDIEQIARDHTVCPFELSLDMLSGADVVVCDYNYVFDPVVYLRRCFDEPIDEHSFLVDEVHNLVDRGRDMFSAQIEKERIVSVKALLKKNHHAGLADVMRKLDGLNRAFLALRKKHQEPLDRQGFAVIKEIPSPLIVKLQAFCDFLQCWLVENDRQSSHYSRLLELYFEALRFTRTAEFFDSHYVCLIKTGMKNALSIHLYCVNPARLLATGLARSKSTILFSATLTPINYYQQLLGVRPDTHFVDLPSPFPQHNQAVFVVKNIATNYRQRSDSYNNIAELIAATIRAHRGNYLVYFPSYQYMGDVYDVFRRQNPSEDTIVQQRHMDDDSRQSFLAHFDQANASGLVGFAVMGGIFGEGIDLKGSRLVGVIVVGVGLPQIGIERDLIKQHFSQSASDEAVPRQQDPDEGFSYAYQYPGMNRVLQTAGRVIRSDQDRGIICLIDSRFASSRYHRLFPPHWTNLHVINQNQLASQLDQFWLSIN